MVGGLFEAPWVPTRLVDFERIETLANIKPGMTFFDLGSGMGGLLFYLASKYPEAKFKGIEIAPILFYRSPASGPCFIRTYPVSYGDVKRANLDGVDVAYLFLMPDSLGRLKHKLFEDLPAEAKIITAVWGFDFAKEEVIDKCDRQVDYYVYTAGEIMPSSGEGA